MSVLSDAPNAWVFVLCLWLGLVLLALALLGCGASAPVNSPYYYPRHDCRAGGEVTYHTADKSFDVTLRSECGHGW